MLKKYNVKIRIANYDDPIDLSSCFQGIEKLLFVSGSEVQKRHQQHINVVDAANNAMVPHIIYTSFHRRTDDEDSPIAMISKTHIETEKYIIKNGITYTFLQNALYADVMPMFLGPDVVNTGINVPAGEGRAPFATRRNLAEAAANVLAAMDGHENKIYKTVNTENYSFEDIARVLSELTGKQIRYTSPPMDEYKQSLIKAGIPAEAVAGSAGFIEGIRQGYFEADHSDLEMLLGRKPDGLKEILRSFVS